MADIKISIINQSTVLTDDQIKAVVPALQKQIHNDFAPIWGIDADLIFVGKTETPDPSTWWMVMLDDSDTDGALGYHELNSAGLPIGKVFAKSDKKYGLEWTVTLSHELLEMIADPDINLTSFIQTSPTAGYMYAFEMCDAVEDDVFGYQIDGVLVSDFVLPSYFQPEIPAKKWDFRGHLTGPVPAMLHGGYLSKFSVGHKLDQPGWNQITAQKLVEGVEVDSRATRKLSSSRRSKRAKDRSEWKKSNI